MASIQLFYFFYFFFLPQIAAILHDENKSATGREDSVDVNCEGMWGNTPLIAAAQYGHLEVARLLVEKFGADVRRANRCGATALLFACAEVHRGPYHPCST